MKYLTSELRVLLFQLA